MSIFLSGCESRWNIYENIVVSEKVHQDIFSADGDIIQVGVEIPKETVESIGEYNRRLFCKTSSEVVRSARNGIERQIEKFSIKDGISFYKMYYSRGNCNTD